MSFAFKVDWITPPEGGEDAGHELAWGRGILYLNDKPVWHSGKRDDPEPTTWSWIELLEFLADRWPWISGEQGYPQVGRPPSNPLLLRETAISSSGDGYLSDYIDEEIFHFEGRHDLARGMNGISLPSIMIVREGNTACIAIEGSDKPLSAPIDEVLASLEAIAETIVEEVSKAARSERAKIAINNWKKRAAISDGKKLQLITGLDLLALKQSGLPPTLDGWELSSDTFADSELAAAARFARSGNIETRDSFAQDRARILEEIKKVPARSLSLVRIDQLSLELAPVLKEYAHKDPFEQGYQLALAIRKKLGLDTNVDDVADPEQFLRDYGIDVIELALSPGIDGIGCWGPRHGPVVFVNYRGKRSQEHHGKRATLAHEICHLLVDRNRALPFAEVMGGRSPYIPERRANAFAAEFLVPRYIVQMSFRRFRDLSKSIEALMAQYQVGKVLVANQLYHSADRLGFSSWDMDVLKDIIQTGDGEGYYEY